MKFSKTRPVKVVQLGAGGTGGHIAPHLYRLLYALDRPVRYIICDGDVVEEKNLVRQNFTPADLGENKAKVLAERYSNVFGLETEYVPSFVETEEQLRELLTPGRWQTGPYGLRIIREMVILLGAVDNNKSRQLCHRVFHQARELIYIDSGNGEFTGQVVCGIRQAGKTMYPPIGTAYPDVLEDTDKFPTELSCAEASVSAPQSMAANITAATAVVDLVYNILALGESTVRQATFSTRSVNVRPTIQQRKKKEESGMRATVDAKIFAETLKYVSKVIRSSSFPVMDGVLVQFENGGCAMTGTDFVTCLTMELPARGDSFAFVFQKPQAVIKACRYFDGDLSLELRLETKYPVVELTCGRRSGTFDAYLAKDYPAQPRQKQGVSFTTNAATLLNRVERVKYAARAPVGNSNDAQRTCVQFHGNRVFCVDGHRAACDTDPSMTFPVPFLTWGDSLSYLKLMGDSEVRVRVEEDYIRLTSDTVSLCCHREGVDTFNLMDAVPRRFLEDFSISPKEFLRELEYLAGFQPKRKSAVRFCGGRMDLQDCTSRCSTEVGIEGVNEIMFAFDLRFMRDALKQFSSEARVKVKISGCNTPIIIEAEGRSDFALVLPVRLNRVKAA